MMARGLVGPAAIAALIGLARDISEGAAPPDKPAPAALTEGEPVLAASPFDRWMDGLNRLPRPLLAFGTLALFSFAMLDPARFAQRMVGLKEIPEPLWWLLGGVVGFYFGAREAHYFRARSAPAPIPPAAPPETNPALDAWKAGAPE